MFKSKKGVSELISFVFITLIIVVTSVSAYFVSKSVIDSTIIDVDRDNMGIYLKKMSQRIDEVKVFNNASNVIDVSFKKGLLEFNNNQVIYHSLKEYSSTAVSCFSQVCFKSVNDYEVLYYNLTDSYTFSDNVTLNPGAYTLIFRNIKSGNKIEIRFR